MAKYRTMRRLARWHIWLGWLVAIPLLLWTVSGLIMVARPIDEVRGTTMRINAPEQALPANFTPALPFLAPGQPSVAAYTLSMRHSVPTARVDYADKQVALFDARSGTRLTPLDRTAALETARRGVAGVSDTAISVTPFAANAVPFDFRKAMPVWQVALTDGTHIYVGRDTGEIEAVRTRYWRLFDFMWGLHIMDPQTREDTHHPLLIASAVLALVSVVFGTALLFRRRKAKR
jgi:uncharacterized iron-regulated membrane protein